MVDWRDLGQNRASILLWRDPIVRQARCQLILYYVNLISEMFVSV